MGIVDLQARRQQSRPPGAPPPDDLYAAADMVRRYVLSLMAWSEQAHGAADTACGDLCCFADCIERQADALWPRADGKGAQ